MNRVDLLNYMQEICGHLDDLNRGRVEKSNMEPKVKELKDELHNLELNLIASQALSKSGLLFASDPHSPPKKLTSKMIKLLESRTLSDFDQCDISNALREISKQIQFASPIENLPDEMIYEISSHLDRQDLLAVLNLSKIGHRVAGDPRLLSQAEAPLQEPADELEAARPVKPSLLDQKYSTILSSLRHGEWNSEKFLESHGDALAQVQSLDLTRVQYKEQKFFKPVVVTLELLSFLETACPKLKHLSIHHEGKFPIFRTLPKQLTSLDLSQSRFTRHEIPFIQRLSSITHMNFRFCRGVSENLLMELSKMPELKSLNLIDTDATNRGIQIFELVSDCDAFGIGGKRLTNSCFQSVGKMEKLHTLLIRRGRFSDHGLRHLQPLQNVHTLSLEGSTFSGNGLAYLTKYARLKTLNLSSCSSLTDEGMKNIMLFQGLETLKLRFATIHPDFNELRTLKAKIVSRIEQCESDLKTENSEDEDKLEEDLEDLKDLLEEIEHELEVEQIEEKEEEEEEKDKKEEEEEVRIGRLTPSAFHPLEELEFFETLDLTDVKFQGQSSIRALENIARSKSLKNLDLTGCANLRPEAVERLSAHSSLENISFYGCLNLNTECLLSLLLCKNLKHLDIRKCPNLDLARIQRQLKDHPQLEVLMDKKPSTTKRIVEAQLYENSLQRLLDKCIPTDFDIFEEYQVLYPIKDSDWYRSDFDRVYAKELKYAKSLDFTQFQASKKLLRFLAKKCPNLEHISLHDKGIDLLKELPKDLGSLSLITWRPLDFKTADALKRFSKLETLTIRPHTLSGIPPLRQLLLMPSLRRLQLEDLHLTTETCDFLSQTFSLEDLRLINCSFDSIEDIVKIPMLSAIDRSSLGDEEIQTLNKAKPDVKLL